MLFDLEFVEGNIEDFIEKLALLLSKDVDPFLIQTVNVDHIVQMTQDNKFKQIARNARFITADGMPIVAISRFFGQKINRITGADLTIRLCEQSQVFKFKLFFLGAAPQVLEKAVERARNIYKGEIVGWYSPSYEEVADESQDERICKIINASGANVLLVAFGAPKQEKWITRNLSRVSTRVNIGVGASIDFIAGTQKRAPVWLQKIGFEWLYRLVTNPKRMGKRYLLRDPLFLIIVIKELLRKIRS